MHTSLIMASFQVNQGLMNPELAGYILELGKQICVDKASWGNHLTSFFLYALTLMLIPSHWLRYGITTPAANAIEYSITYYTVILYTVILDFCLFGLYAYGKLG